MPKLFLSFEDQIRYLMLSQAMTEERLNAYMGFPENWRKITSYKK